MQETSINLVLVEDNSDLCEDIQFQLEQHGITVSIAEDALALDALLQTGSFDIAVLDIGLPGEDGLSIAERLHHAFPNMGIIMLTARSELDMRLQGLENGADIYLVKPVDLRELLAQVRALHRRLNSDEQANKTHGWVLKASGRELASPQGKVVSLTHMEGSIMLLLAQHAGDKVSREQFINKIAGNSSHHFDPHRLEVCISRLRQKLLDAMGPQAGQQPLPLKTARGVGYIFTAPVVIDQH